jgi:hypothetical protein
MKKYSRNADGTFRKRTCNWTPKRLEKIIKRLEKIIKREGKIIERERERS